MRNNPLFSITFLSTIFSLLISGPSGAQGPSSRTIEVYRTTAADTFIDESTGVKINLPLGQFGAPVTERYGRSWTSPERRKISVDTLNFGNTTKIDDWYGKLVNIKNRRLTKKDFDGRRFVVEGREVSSKPGNDSLFHIEAEVFNNEVRGLSVIYSADQTDMAPVSQSIIQSFVAFPNKIALPVANKVREPVTLAPPPSAAELRLQNQIEQKKNEAAKVDEETKRREQTTTVAPPPEVKKSIQDSAAERQNQIERLQAELDRVRREAVGPFPGKRRALVIGNNLYRGLGANNQLERAVNDARGMEVVLRDLGFTVTRGENLSKFEMNRYLENFSDTIQPGDMALVFYAGHGVAMDGGSFLLPSDAQQVDKEALVREMSVSENRFVEAIQPRNPNLAILIFDSCRSNPLGGGTRGVTTRGNGRPTEGDDVVTIYSAGRNQEALDSLGSIDRDRTNSLFSRNIIAQLYNRDQDLSKIMRIVRTEVETAAKSVGRIQTPALYDGTGGRASEIFIADSLPANGKPGVGGVLEPIPVKN